MFTSNYNNVYCTEGLRDVKKRHNLFNNPYCDTPIHNIFKSGIHRCAYKTIEEFKKWVTPNEVKLLIKSGFNIYLIKASETYMGDYQAIFNPKTITLKENVNSLFE